MEGPLPSVLRTPAALRLPSRSHGKMAGADVATMRAFRDNLGGYVNHNFFWRCLAPRPKTTAEPSGALADKINRQWGTFEVCLSLAA